MIIGNKKFIQLFWQMLLPKVVKFHLLFVEHGFIERMENITLQKSMVTR